MSGKEYDVFRDSLCRYLGYANRFGEAFRENSQCKQSLTNSVVKGSYLATISYILADTISKSMKVPRKDSSKSKKWNEKKVKEAAPTGNSMGKVAFKAGDAFIWQMLSSVIIPGFIADRFACTSSCLLRGAKTPGHMIAIIPTVVGLGILPLISRPIDRFVDSMMDKFYRIHDGQNANQTSKSNKR